MNYLNEAVELDLLDQALDEAGGLISWIKRRYTAVDGKLPGELEAEIQRGVRHEAHRSKLLDEIDEFIREAENAETGSSTDDFWKGSVAGTIMRGNSHSSGKIRDYVKALKDVRAKVAAAKVKD